MREIERPLDVLNRCKDRKVTITLKDGKEIEGVLLAFDMNINLGVDMGHGLRFIRGDNVLFLEKKGGGND